VKAVAIYKYFLVLVLQKPTTELDFVVLSIL